MAIRRTVLPALRHVGNGPNARELAQRLRDGVMERDAVKVQQALRDGASRTTQVQWARGTPQEWIGWLDCAVLAETRNASGSARSENVASSGVIETMIENGVHSWTALARYPNRSWASHPSFIALEEDCLNQLMTLQGNHPLMRKARAGKAVRGVIPGWSFNTRMPDEPTWLHRAVYHDRLDVVEHWLKLGAPVTQDRSVLETPWRTAWARRFSMGSLGLPMAGTEVIDRLEQQVLATATDDAWRHEVLGLLDLLAMSRPPVEQTRRVGMLHPATSEALTVALSRVLEKRPIVLALSHEEANRTPNAAGIAAEMLHQENVLLRRAFVEPSGINSPGMASPTLDVSMIPGARRRL